MKNTKKLKPISLYIVSALISFALLFLVILLPIKTQAATIGYVDSYCLNVRSGPSTNYSVIGQIAYQNVVITGQTKDGSGDLWYQINYNGQTAYIFGEWVIDVHEESASKEAEATFEDQLAKFPLSYHSYLKAIHSVYPNYSFIPDYLSISFDDAVYQETLSHRKLVELSTDGNSWRSCNPSVFHGTYWDTFCGGWTDAAIDVIEYYMDPRNFLTTDKMYIFAKQTFSNTESADLVKKIVASTFLAGSYNDITGTHTYVDTIMQAAKDSGVSAYVIAAIIVQEQGATAGSLCNGSSGYYNFFNDGASGGSSAEVINNGINFAKNNGWNTVYKSILGGANIYKTGYIANNQDTYFYKDFNLINMNFNHQYAQSVYDQIGNAYFLRKAISGDTKGQVTLRIPVYTTMPKDVCPCPADTSSLSKRYDSKGNIIARSGETIKMEPAGKSSKPEEKVQPTPTPTPEPQTTTTTYKKGDANGDGKISPADYLIVKNYILGKYNFTDSAKKAAADATGDGKVSPADYLKIKNTILGK